MMKAILISTVCLLLIIPGKVFCRGNIAQDSASVATIKKFIESHTRYPATARENHIAGTVFLYFNINSDRTIGNIEIIKAIKYGCADEAIRVLKLCPFNSLAIKMDPGAYTCAVDFTLKGDKALAADTDSIAKPQLYFKNFLFEAHVIGYASIMHRVVMRERTGYITPQFDDHAGKIHTMVISSYNAVNRNGKMVKDSLNGRIIEKFDEKGNLVNKASFDAKGIKIGRTEYVYNKAGYLIAESARRGNGELYRKQKFNYNELGKKVEEINYNPTNDSLYNRIVFTYNDKGAIMLQAAHNANRGIQYVTVYKYDTNNKPSAQITYDSDMKPGTRKVFRYTAPDQMEEAEYSSEDSLNYREVNNYDSKHRLIKTDGYNNEGHFQSSNSYAYDARGNKAEDVLDKSDKYAGTKSVFMYGTYDKHGNWRSVKWTSGYLGKSYIVERNVVY